MLMYRFVIVVVLHIWHECT